MNSKNLPLSSRILLEKKKGKSKQRWHLGTSGITTCSMNSQSLPCFSGINSSKKGKFGVKIVLGDPGVVRRFQVRAEELFCPYLKSTHSPWVSEDEIGYTSLTV